MITIPPGCFLIVHPQHGQASCNDEALPEFARHGWTRAGAEPQSAPPAPVQDAPPAPAVDAPKARKPRATPAPVKDAHGAFG